MYYRPVMRIFINFALLFSPLVSCYTLGTNSKSTLVENASSDRKTFIRTVVGAALAGTTLLNPKLASAGSSLASDKLTDVYFGVGCFWHIQHEFIEAERALLKRSDTELTSRAGYAGGTKTGKDGTVCYHNFQGLSDYGKLGHGEVVGMTLPESSIGDFSKVYFSLFGPKGQRVDPLDIGPEYRSLLGLPGGKNHAMYEAVEQAAIEKNFQLVEGKGNDPDTLKSNKIWVMDSNQFPFYQAEVYHQYHNDFQSPPYGKAYNSLVKVAYNQGNLKYSICPDREIV